MCSGHILSEVAPVLDHVGNFSVICLAGGHRVQERIGMTGSFNTGIVDCFFLGVNGKRSHSQTYRSARVLLSSVCVEEVASLVLSVCH